MNKNYLIKINSRILWYDNGVNIMLMYKKRCSENVSFNYLKFNIFHGVCKYRYIDSVDTGTILWFEKLQFFFFFQVKVNM